MPHRGEHHNSAHLSPILLRQLKTQEHMRTPKLIPLFLLVLAVLPGVANAQTQLKSFTMKVSGTSTLHEWESGVDKIEWKGQLGFDANKNLTLQQVEVKIPVESIKSEHGKLMDGKTYEAFNNEKNPYIIFKPRKVVTKASGADVLLTIEGDLTMNGVTNLIMLSVIGKSLPGGDMRFTGTRGLKMTDYKMKPPTAMMGTVKVGDEVTVKFDLTFSKLISL
jgi:polyisoprenoid-binding protein YceI